MKYLILAAAIAVGACSDDRGEMTEARRITLCDLGLPSAGEFVTLRLDGHKAQVVSVMFKWQAGSIFADWQAYDENDHAFCAHVIRVRVALHGIASEGGRWNTAKPEVYPILNMRRFEIVRDQ